ncbi:MAG TPA: HD domain-containing phosphohydrolase [Solirubrobacteraceae bacterium]|nr:HD domain-containing phosphohydrolase [Solirubrobacteraceae bacterium]
MTAAQASPVVARVPVRRAAAVAVAGAGLAGTLVWFALISHRRLSDPLLFVLLAGAIGAELTRTRYSSRSYLSASFACSMLAVAFLGPAAVFLLTVVTELVLAPAQRRNWRIVLVNLFVTGLPALAAGSVFAALSRGVSHTDARFEIALAAVAAGALALNFLLANSLLAAVEGEPVLPNLRPPRAFYPALVLNLALTVAVAGVYAKFGLAASAFILIVVVAFNYMYHLVAAARERAREYASLSWGVLSGLVRALEVRDSRSARHSAAVAAFARDIAHHCGLSERDCELAHTAGLLHDIGKFALSDRAMDRGGTLADLDWQAIRQHPALGADMLRDLGLYGPVADIVIAHHERPDGRGYPLGLKDDEIPDIAKIVAVAEVYDTLTAEGTYRTRMNSFEALTELRRVAGRQLEGRYVEAMAELLAGQGVEYRHRDDADFYRELDLERRINEASVR